MNQACIVILVGCLTCPGLVTGAPAPTPADQDTFCAGFTPADLKVPASPLSNPRLARCQLKCIPIGGPTPSDAQLQACINGAGGGTGAGPGVIPPPPPPPAPPLPPPPPSATPSSAFDRGVESWGSGSFPDGGPYDRVIGATTPLWTDTAGHPGGAIFMNDPGGGNYFFEAPASYVGDKRGFYGGELRYEISIKGGPLFDEVDVILLSPGSVLVYQHAARPSNGWTPFAVQLTEAGWRVGTLSGRPATAEEFSRALAGISALRIRGEYGNGPDSASLDNVRLVPR